jgi:hypothetical protein
VVYRVDLEDRVDVTPRGEAFRAAWLRPEQLGPDSAATAAALDQLFRTCEPGATHGRLLR